MKSLVFESFVNSERCKTCPHHCCFALSLRALLIQKDVKPRLTAILPIRRLRALLIQKDVKLSKEKGAKAVV